MAGDLTLFFNPACSKCRGAAELLRERGIEPVVVEYLDAPPSVDEIRRVLGLLGAASPRDMMRTSEPLYTELGLDDPARPDDDLVAAMAAHPILIQRPIVIAGDRAVIARPPERLLDLL